MTSLLRPSNSTMPSGPSAGQVAGAQPAVVGEHAGGGLGGAPVALEHTRARHPQLAHRARRHLAAVVVDHPQRVSRATAKPSDSPRPDAGQQRRRHLGRRRRPRPRPCRSPRRTWPRRPHPTSGSVTVAPIRLKRWASSGGMTSAPDAHTRTDVQVAVARRRPRRASGTSPARRRTAWPGAARWRRAPRPGRKRAKQVDRDAAARRSRSATAKPMMWATGRAITASSRRSRVGQAPRPTPADRAPGG